MLRRKGLRVGDIQARAPQAAIRQHLRQGLTVHAAPPAAVEEDGVPLHAQQPRLVKETDGAGGLRQREGHHIRRGEQRIQRFEAVHALDARGRLGRVPPHAAGAGPQGLAQPGEGAAQVAGAHHQHLSAQQSLDRAQVPPKRPVLLVPVTGQALHQRQQQCEQVF